MLYDEADGFLKKKRGWRYTRDRHLEWCCLAEGFCGWWAGWYCFVMRERYYTIADEFKRTWLCLAIKRDRNNLCSVLFYFVYLFWLVSYLWKENENRTKSGIFCFCSITGYGSCSYLRWFKYQTKTVRIVFCCLFLFVLIPNYGTCSNQT